MTVAARKQNVVPLIEQAPPRLARGTAARQSDQGWVVMNNGCELLCRRAASCLIEPIQGDQLLLALEQDGTSYILAVLERSQDVPVALKLDGDAELSSSGVLRLKAAEGLELMTQQNVRVAAKGLEVSAMVADVAVSRVSAVGEQLHNHFDAIRSIAGQLESVAERVIERAKSRYQYVERTDHLRAAQVDVRAEQTVSLRGRHAVVAAREVVKVDGDQVHVG